MRHPHTLLFTLALTALIAAPACGDADGDGPVPSHDVMDTGTPEPDVPNDSGQASDEGPSPADVVADSGGTDDAGTDDAVTEDVAPVGDATAAEDATPETDGGDDPPPNDRLSPPVLPECDTSGASDDVVASGTYALGVFLTPLNMGGSYLAEVVGGPEGILEIALTPTLGDWIHDQPTARVCDVPVAADGSFSISIAKMIQPGETTPLGFPVALGNNNFEGTVQEDGTLCGTMDGTVVLLSLSLEGSTFKAVPLDQASDPMESSCDPSGGPTIYAPIETCPAITEGWNDMESATLSRGFIVQVPESGTGPFPVVFNYHGLGGTAQGLVDSTVLDDLVDEEGFILVHPDGAKDESGEKLFPTSWTWLAPNFDMDNPDLVFFDDILTCLGEAYDVDAERVYATGISAGGLWSSFLGLNRADVVAAAAPFSGGYAFQIPSETREIPYMVSWGGPTDLSTGQDFHTLGLELLEKLTGHGSFALACNHGMGHAYSEVWELHAIAWDFLSRFTLSGPTGDPFGGVLPESYPDYCALPE